MSMRGRSNRSGSDPAPSPYRPENWTPANGRRFRDGRSMSTDSNTATKMNALSAGNGNYYNPFKHFGVHYHHHHHHTHGHHMQRPAGNLARSRSGPCTGKLIVAFSLMNQ